MIAKFTESWCCRWDQLREANPNRKSVGKLGKKPLLGEIENELFAWIQTQRASRLIVTRPAIQMEALRLVDNSKLPQSFKEGQLFHPFLLGFVFDCLH